MSIRSTQSRQSQQRLRQPAGTPVGGQFAEDPGAKVAAPVWLCENPQEPHPPKELNDQARALAFALPKHLREDANVSISVRVEEVHDGSVKGLETTGRVSATAPGLELYLKTTVFKSDDGGQDARTTAKATVLASEKYQTYPVNPDDVDSWVPPATRFYKHWTDKEDADEQIASFADEAFIQARLDEQFSWPRKQFAAHCSCTKSGEADAYAPCASHTYGIAPNVISGGKTPQISLTTHRDAPDDGTRIFTIDRETGEVLSVERHGKREPDADLERIMADTWTCLQLSRGEAPASSAAVGAKLLMNTLAEAVKAQNL